MSVNVLSAAKWLAKSSGWKLSNLELQKILYIAHMFYLGRTGGDALVDGTFEAWHYGPVHPELYHKLKIFGVEHVGDIFHSVDDLDEGKELKVLVETFNHFGNVDPGKLVHVTHNSGGAWDLNYKSGVSCSIPNTDILKEYNRMKEKRKKLVADSDTQKEIGGCLSNAEGTRKEELLEGRIGDYLPNNEVTVQDKLLNELVEKLEKERDAREEYKFIGILILVLLFDMVFSSEIPSSIGRLVSFFLELLIVITLAKKMIGIEYIRLMLSRVLYRITGKAKQDSD